MKIILPERVVVKRSQWVRGVGGFGTKGTGNMGVSKLLQSDVHMASDGVQRRCCLGFWCSAAGFDDDVLWGAAAPDSIALFDTLNIPGLLTTDGRRTIICQSMMTVNDDPRMSDEEREQKLTSLAKELGVEMVFED